MIIETDDDLIEFQKIFDPDLDQLASILSRIVGDPIDADDLTEKMDETFGKISKTLKTQPNKDFMKEWSLEIKEEFDEEQKPFKDHLSK